MDDRINDIIIRTLIGESSQEEKEELGRWASESEQNRAYLREQNEIWFSASTSSKLRRFDKDRASQLFLQRIGYASSQRKRLHKRLFRYAAALLLIVVSITVALNYGWRNTNTEHDKITVYSPEDSRSKVLLPDGSTVWVNSQSQIIYAQDFGLSERRISMEGECFFEVKHQDNKPFVVSAGNTEVRVKGTKFNVADYKSDMETVVTLEEGLVALSSKTGTNEEIMLHPGHRAVINKKSGTIRIEECDANCTKEWTYDTIKLDGLPLAELAEKLSQAYNVQIIVDKNNVDALYFSGMFVRQTDSIDDILDILSATGKIKYRKYGKKYIIQ